MTKSPVFCGSWRQYKDNEHIDDDLGRPEGIDLSIDVEV